MRLSVGDRVEIVSCEGFGGPATVIGYRDAEHAHYKVHMDDGNPPDFWAHDFEIVGVVRPWPPRIDSRIDTYRHIQTVQRFMGRAIVDLIRRQQEHDQSKLVSPEVEVFDEFTPKLAGSTYGSEEYRGYLAAMKPAIEHHNAANSHHPEHGEPDLTWVSVPEFEGFYEFSNYGDIRSVTRTISRSGSQGNLTIQGQDMTAHRTPKGYVRVRLQKNGSGRNLFIHRLVAEVFVPNPDNKPEVNHKDGDKTNNRSTNLEWVTSSENQIHAYDSGLKEPSVKYVVHCPELDLTAFGTQAMERALRERGYDRVSAAGIWSAMDRGGKHLDLTFEGTMLAEWRRSRIRGMNLLDIVEMLCDWKAAGLRTDPPGDIRRSIEINQERFGYSDELRQILLNTLPLIEGEASLDGETR